jgi:hypothetical protein
MIIIWLMMVNSNLVGGWPTPLKNMELNDDYDRLDGGHGPMVPKMWKIPDETTNGFWGVLKWWTGEGIISQYIHQ